MKKVLLSLTIAIGLFTTAVLAKDIYVAPLAPDVACVADGSEACPYVGLDKGIAVAVGGDTILLADGIYGPINTGKTFESPVEIRSINGNKAQLTKIHFGATAKNYTLRNLTIAPAEGDSLKGYLVRAYVGASYLTFDNLLLYGNSDYSNMVDWPKEKWLTINGEAFDLRGKFNTLTNNKIYAVFTGMTVGSNSIVSNNLVDGFMGDGGKATAGSTWSDNLIKNHFDVSGFHTDGIQAASKSVMADLTIKNNKIFEWTYLDKPDHPMRGGVQGIGMFDGIYKNLVVENNLVVTNNAHGIAIYGIDGGRIVNNTVVTSRGSLKYPWIKIASHKDGRQSVNVLVANNVAASYQIGNGSGSVVSKNNFVLTDRAATFTDHVNLDFSPLEGGPLVDTADAASAPEFDLNGNSRMNGKPDIGAIELSRMCN